MADFVAEIGDRDDEATAWVLERSCYFAPFGSGAPGNLTGWLDSLGVQDMH